MKTMLMMKIKTAAIAVSLSTCCICTGLLTGTWLLAGEKTEIAKTASSNTMQWPQWRGPNRDGVAPNSPPLIDKWPEKGLKQLWHTKGIPGARCNGWDQNRQGGSGSLAIGGGKVVLLGHTKETKKFKVEERELIEWGWHPEMPEELYERVEKIRVQGVRHIGPYTIPMEDCKANANKLIASLDSATAKKFGDAITKRLTTGRMVVYKIFKKLFPLAGMEFNSMDDLIKAVGGGPWTLMVTHGPADSLTIHTHYLRRESDYFDKVYCLDAKSGKVLWQKEFPGSHSADMYWYWHASSTPTIAGEKCYVQGSKNLYCLSLNDGKLLWQQEIPCSHSSPLLVDDRVVTHTHELTAFHADSGKELWRIAEIKNDTSSPILWKHGGNSFVICFSKRQNLHCVDPVSGKILWTSSSWSKKLLQSPILVGSEHVLLQGGNKLAYFRLSPDKAELLWQGGKGNRGGSPVVYRDILFFFSISGLHCLDLKTGKEKWIKKCPKTESTSPVVADGKVYTYTIEKKRKKSRWCFIQFAASGDSYQEQGRMKIDPAAFSSPAIVDGRLYLRLEDGIACYDLRKK